MVERKWVELLYPTRHIFVERNGISYVIHEGPPLMQYNGDKNFFNTPDEPHVVEISDLSLFTSRDGKVETLIRAANSNLRALEIHGEWSGGRWFPAGKRFKHAGITIPDIVEDYEKASKKKIDIVTACTGADMSFARYGIFPEAKIYMLRGQSYGGITINSMTGGLSLTMQVEDSRDVSYREWLQVNQQRLKGQDDLAVLKK